MDSNKQEHIKAPPLGGGGVGLCQTVIAVVSFVVAVAFAVAGFITPPQGELHDSNLYLIAQFLLVTTSIFGVSAVVTHGRWKIESRV